MTGTVGVVGLGAMGRPIAEHLVDAGVTTMVLDTDRAVVDQVVSRGAKAAGSLAEIASGSDVTPELMVERGLIHAGDGRVKILGDGLLSKPLTVRAHGFSSKAKEKIEALGGKAELLP